MGMCVPHKMILPRQSLWQSVMKASHWKVCSCLVVKHGVSPPYAIVDPSACWEADNNARISKTKGRSAEMQRVWETCRLPVALKMEPPSRHGVCAYLLLVLLFGSKTCALTQKHADWKWCTRTAFGRTSMYARLAGTRIVSLV